MIPASPSRSTSKNEPRRSTPSTYYLLAVLPILVPFCFYLLVIAYTDTTSLVHPSLRRSKSILWITAHPDDESLFFAPSIIHLLGQDEAPTGHLLCLSTGDHEGVGRIRKDELKASCKTLSIGDEDCIALDVPELRDDPTTWWPEDTVEKIVRGYIERWDVDLIITFDDYGVSGHANHRAVSSAITQASLADPTFPRALSLHSTNVLAKYTSLLTLPYLLLSHHTSSSPSSLILSSPDQYRLARQSFDQHQSQGRWYRTLFMLFSRYMWVVELIEIA